MDSTGSFFIVGSTHSPTYILFIRYCVSVNIIVVEQERERMGESRCVYTIRTNHRSTIFQLNAIAYGMFNEFRY